MNRREILRTLGLVGSAISFMPALRVVDAVSETLTALPSSTPLTIPTRPLGRTGVDVSILALGGSHLGRVKSERDATRLVHEAIDARLTFMDNAWEYHDGRSEEWMGKALEGRRHAAFLMTKVCSHGRGKTVALRQLEESLRRLRTDYLDLWQIHEVIYEDDPDRHFAPGGAAEALLEAKQQGKVRFIGFTGHKDPAIHLKSYSTIFPSTPASSRSIALTGAFAASNVTYSRNWNAAELRPWR
ncbi:MAG TPA: aldo/keto reductase [Nitrospiraceae bacterium]|nr:aldo/keto reductase [Nitrospiraceae bacterium]